MQMEITLMQNRAELVLPQGLYAKGDSRPKMKKKSIVSLYRINRSFSVAT